MADDPSDALVATLYDELHRLAHHYMRGAVKRDWAVAKAWLYRELKPA